MVREVVRAGADVIKFFNTGFGRATQSGSTRSYDPDEVRALVDEAHIHGKTVACHAIGGPGLRTAIEAGVDSIEHGCLLGQEPDLLKMMADQGSYLVPTFTVLPSTPPRETPTPRRRPRNSGSNTSTPFSKPCWPG